MISIRTIVCPVDFSSATKRQVDTAVDLCRTFGARLVLHHNVADVAVGAGVGWMWRADRMRDERSIDTGLRELMAGAAADVSVEARVTRGAATEAVLAVSREANADLVVLSTHGQQDADHASVTEHMLEHSDTAVLVLHDTGAEHAWPCLIPHESDERITQVMIVPTDLSDRSRASVSFAFDLARALPVQVHLLHVLRHRTTREDRQTEALEVRQRLDSLVPPELRSRARVHVSDGDPASGITSMAAQLSAACIVMGEHTRAPVRRWLSRDTSRAVLRRAPCPVWYVPGGRAA